MENENENEIKRKKKGKRNKISLYLIGFYAGVIAISDLGLKYYLKDIKDMNTPKFTKIQILIKVAYLIKPLYGLLIDFIPIFGYKKKSYLLICFLINIVSWCIILLNFNNFILSIICHFLINITISFTTVIGSAIQVEISMLEDKQNEISNDTTSLMSQYYIIKTYGALIPSFFNGFLIEKFSYEIIFYFSGFFSIFIFISGINLDEDKYIRRRITRSPSRIDFEPLRVREEVPNNRILNLLNNEKVLCLLLLIFFLESSPSCSSPLFYYEINILGLTAYDLGLIDFLSQIAIIIFIKIYKKYFSKINFKTITFFVRILIFGSFSLIYLLITKSTQKYVNDFILLAFSSSLRVGLHSLAQLPYRVLCIKYSRFGLEASTFAFCDCICNLGNIAAEYIDYFCAFYFNVTHYDFINIGKLVFTENILNLIPLIYIWATPKKFFSTENGNTSEQELSPLQDNNNNNNINNNDNNNGHENNNVIMEENDDNSINNENIIDNIIETFVSNEDENITNNYNYNDLSLGNYQSYRHLSH